MVFLQTHAGKEYNDRKHLVPHSDLYVLVKNKMIWRSLLDTDGFIHHGFCTLNAHANRVLKENDISVTKKIVLTFELLESAFAKSPGVHLDSMGLWEAHSGNCCSGG